MPAGQALLVGSGILLLASGLRYAPVADAGVFAPSMLPIYVALLSRVWLGERFSRPQLVGFGLIIVGALAVGGWEAEHHWRQTHAVSFASRWIETESVSDTVLT